MPVASLLMSSLGGSGGGGGSSSGGGPGQAIANNASGILHGLVGLSQKKKAKRMLAGLQQPQYTIPNEVLKNQKMAELSANEGLPSQQYKNAMQNIQQRQNSLLSASKDRRSALMALPQLQRQANAATLNLDIADANAVNNNRKTLYGINSQVGQYRDKAFDINRMQPYQRDYGYAMGLLGAGNQNFISGLDKIIAGGGQLIDAGTGGGGGGGGKKKSASTSDPNYYNGYGANSSYSGFETPTF